jgi:4-diphosphocytidyl-2-C-methyl-D-erythritol kinase
VEGVVSGRDDHLGADVKIWFAPAKLNLFLHVIGRRADGYHLLQSAFTLIDFGDTLRFTVRDDGMIRRMTVHDGVAEENDLVVRAAKLLQRESKTTLGCDIWLEKRTPMGGGLGGGSSDAATTLMALNSVWNTRFERKQLQTIGLALGADVPFFIFGRSAFAEGVGEKLAAIAIPPAWYVVLTPPVAVATEQVFRSPELTRDTIPLKIADFSAVDLVNCKNDLQAVVLKAFPAVAHCFNALSAASQKSIFGARMTGSGACVFAAFAREADARDAFATLALEHNGFVARGLDCHPLSFELGLEVPQ